MTDICDKDLHLIEEKLSGTWRLPQYDDSRDSITFMANGTVRVNCAYLSTTAKLAGLFYGDVYTGSWQIRQVAPKDSWIKRISSSSTSSIELVVRQPGFYRGNKKIEVNGPFLLITLTSLPESKLNINSLGRFAHIADWLQTLKEIGTNKVFALQQFVPDQGLLVIASSSGLQEWRKVG
ncbi:hypothetical protein [Myxosarcina sp. GI1(2024)]